MIGKKLKKFMRRAIWVIENSVAIVKAAEKFNAEYTALEIKEARMLAAYRKGLGHWSYVKATERGEIWVRDDDVEVIMPDYGKDPKFSTLTAIDESNPMGIIRSH